VEATSGGGAVRAVAKCDGTLVSIKIDPAAISANDPQLLEDLVLGAVNQALKEGKEIATQEMGKVTQGLAIPGMGGLI
jgi:DNA-binding protein YbaB